MQNKAVFQSHPLNAQCIQCELSWGEHIGVECPSGLTTFVLVPVKQHLQHIILCPARNNDHGQMAAIIFVPDDADPKEILRRAVRDNRGNPSIEKFQLVQIIEEVRN